VSGAIAIKLTEGQISMASHIGVMRRISNLRRSTPPKHGAGNGEGSWEIDINGCCAELAVACYLNLFWCGSLNDYAARDVGGLVDVRSTMKPDRRLPLHPDDLDSVPFVLAWPRPPLFSVYDLVGWTLARDGKRQEFWCDPTNNGRPAFFVPKNVLHPMPALREWTERMRSLTEESSL